MVDGRRVRALPARRASRRAAGALVHAARHRGARRPAGPRARRRGRARRVAQRHVGAADGQHARPAPLSRPGDDRPRGACRRPAGVGCHPRPPGAARLPRPARRPAQPGLRARPPVHVALLHLRLAAAARGHDRASRVDSSRAGAAGRRRAARGPHLDVAAGGRAAVAGARRAARAAGPASVHHRDDGRVGQGGAGGRHRRTGGRRSSRRLGTGVRPGRGSPVGLRGLARRGLADLRRRLRRRHRLRLGGDRSAGLAGAAGVGGRSAAVGVRRRHGRRDRLPARHLDGRLASAGLARGLRGGDDRHRGPSGAGRPARRDPARASLVRVSGNVAPGPRRCHADAPGRRRRRAGRRERRRQDDAREAARQAVRADVGSHPGRRDAALRYRSRPLARASGGRVPGLLPLRVPCPADDRGRRRAPARRRPGRRDRGRTGGRRGRGGAPGVRARYAARSDLAGRGGGFVRPVAEAGPGARLHARRAAAARPRRADRRPRRRDRARVVRALRGRRPTLAAFGRRRGRRRRPRSPCSSRTASRPCGWRT